MAYKLYIGNFAVMWLLFICSVLAAFVLDSKFMNLIFSNGAFLVVPILVVLLLKKSGVKIRLSGFSVSKLAISAMVVLTVLSLPWLFALLHIDISQTWLLNSIFLFPNHIGLHHGYEGWLTLMSVGFLIEPVRRLTVSRLKEFSSVLMVIATIIGLQNVIDDFVIEQLTPRFGINSPFSFLHLR